MKQFLYRLIKIMADLTKLRHSNLHNYQQVHLEGQLNIGSGTTVIKHGLGYIPHVRVWAYHIAGELSPIVVPAAATSYHAAYENVSVTPIDKVAVTTDELRIRSSGGITIYYRIYRDAA